MKTVKQLLSGEGDLRPITLVFDDDRKITCLITNSVWIDRGIPRVKTSTIYAILMTIGATLPRSRTT